MKKVLVFVAMMASIMTTYAQQKTLVLFYSQTGTTQNVAEELQKQLGADIERIEAEKPYDGNFQATIQRGQEEMRNGKALPKADIRQGYGVRTARIASAPKEITRFLIENGYKKGSIKPLPDYSEQQPVTKADCDIFDAACSSYQFPLGTPLTVGKRETEESTDYKFTVKSRGMNGAESTSIIYVTVGKNAKPEFTEVVR